MERASPSLRRPDLVRAVLCTDESVHRRRVEGRVRGIPGWHEIDWGHVERMRREQPALTVPHITVDAIDSIAYNLDKVLTYAAR